MLSRVFALWLFYLKTGLCQIYAKETENIIRSDSIWLEPDYQIKKFLGAWADNNIYPALATLWSFPPFRLKEVLGLLDELRRLYPSRGKFSFSDYGPLKHFEQHPDYFWKPHLLLEF